MERAKCKKKVTDLSIDCKDGLLLAEVIEAVTTFKVPDLIKKPKTQQQMVSLIKYNKFTLVVDILVLWQMCLKVVTVVKVWLYSRTRLTFDHRQQMNGGKYLILWRNDKRIASNRIQVNE